MPLPATQPLPDNQQTDNDTPDTAPVVQQEAPVSVPQAVIVHTDAPKVQLFPIPPTPPTPAVVIPQVETSVLHTLTVTPTDITPPAKHDDIAYPILGFGGFLLVLIALVFFTRKKPAPVVAAETPAPANTNTAAPASSASGTSTAGR